MQSSTALLEKENKDLKRSLHRLEREFSSEVVQYDSKLKQLTSVVKDLENLNPFEINIKLDNLETNRKRMDNAINRLQSAGGKQPNKLNSQVESPIQMVTSRSPCIRAQVVNTGEQNRPMQGEVSKKVPQPYLSRSSDLFLKRTEPRTMQTSDSKARAQTENAGCNPNIQTVNAECNQTLQTVNAECNRNAHPVDVNNAVNGFNTTSVCFLPGVAPFVPDRFFLPPPTGYMPNILTNRSHFRLQFAANPTLFPPPGSLNQVLGGNKYGTKYEQLGFCAGAASTRS